MSRKLVATYLGVLCTSLTGCDALISRWQTVRMQVRTSDNSKAVEGASVTAASMPGPDHYTEQEWLDRFGQEAITDAEGVATIDLEMQFIRGGLFPKPLPPLSAPHARGDSYLVRVDSDGRREVLRVILEPGHHVDGGVYGVTVLDISKARRRK